MTTFTSELLEARDRIKSLQERSEQMDELLKMIEAWDKEQSAVHRHAKLLEIMGFVRKAKRT